MNGFCEHLHVYFNGLTPGSHRGLPDKPALRSFSHCFRRGPALRLGKRPMGGALGLALSRGLLSAHCIPPASAQEAGEMLPVLLVLTSCHSSLAKAT